MTWEFNRNTGDLYDPSGEIRTTIEGPPYSPIKDSQQWADKEVRDRTMSDLTTDELANFAELWIGDLEIVDK